MQELSSDWSHAAVATGIFLVLAARYFLLVGAFYWFFWARDPERWGGRKVYQRSSSPGQTLSEIGWSLFTCLAWALIGAFVHHAWQEGWTLIYTDIAVYGWGYAAGSLVLLAVFHETYFYWVHRLMHTNLLYRYVHRVHHQFVQPGPWAAFSFHPLEVVTEHIILPVMVFLIPLHPAVIAAYLLLMAVSGIVNHLGVEIFPRSRGIAGLGRWLIGATHHAQHHRLYHYNYGLYFTFWDRIAGTQHPDFEADFARVTAKKSEAVPFGDA